MRKKLVLGMVCASMLTMAAGCTPVTPKQVLQDAFTKSATVKSYGFNGGLSLSMDSKEGSTDPQISQALAMLKDAKLTATGKYDEKQKRLEMVLNIALNGDMKVSLDIPVLLNGDKLYVKVPNVPFYPLPKALVGKFIEVDMKELEKKSAESNGKPADTELVTQFIKEAVGIFVDDFGGSEFVSELKKEAIPTDIKDAKHVVQIKVTDATLEKFANTLVKTTLPKVFTLLESEKYASRLGVAKEKIAEARKDLDTTDLSKENFDKMREKFVLDDATLTVGVDKNNYVSHQDVGFNAVIKEGGDTHVKVNISSNITDIDKEQTFATPLPAEKDVIKSDDLGKVLMGGF
jgi:hypothetical protein